MAKESIYEEAVWTADAVVRLVTNPLWEQIPAEKRESTLRLICEQCHTAGEDFVEAEYVTEALQQVLATV